MPLTVALQQSEGEGVHALAEAMENASATVITEVAVRFLKLHQIKVPLECALDGACGATAGDLIERMRRALADARERARPREGGS